MKRFLSSAFLTACLWLVANMSSLTLPQEALSVEQWSNSGNWLGNIHLQLFRE